MTLFLTFLLIIDDLRKPDGEFLNCARIGFAYQQWRRSSARGTPPKKRLLVSRKKRAKVGAEEPKKESKPKETAPKASELSVLRDDEPSFPRGGGSVLTPLERKQIQIQATKDVLFEQKSSRKPAREANNDNDEDDDEDDEMDMEDADTKTPAKKSRKKKSKGKKSEDKGETEKQVRIEGLSYKRIVPGSMILGQVSSINAHDITLSLPNNLVGYVPLTAVSKSLDDRIEKLLSEENDDEDEDGSDDDIFDLKDHFYIGQYLRAYVVSTGTEVSEAGARSKKRIELSVDPRQANTGISKSDLVADLAVQASVVSVEDHGLVMDLGIEGSELKGFMSSKEVDPRVDYSTIKEGSVFLCMVTGQNASGNVIKLSAKLQSAASIKNNHFLSAAPTINSFLPGVAAEILLTEVTAHGMAGKIMGMLDTVVDIVQSGADDGKLDLERKFKIGAKIKGRIVSTFPSAEPFKIGFSMLDHVLKLSSDADGPGSSSDAPAISAIVPEVTVVKVDPGMGVYVQIGESKSIGFVHISRLSDGKVESISSDTGSFKVGSTHEARVVGYNMIDNLYLLSFEKTILEQPFLRLEDVTVGAIVKGKVEKLLIGPTGMDGLIVSLADGITGLVPSMHFADTPLQFPEKKFREGLKISSRILSVDLQKRQIRLTLKKSLLNSESAIWKDYKDITAGAQSPGTIVNLQTHGAVVQFYGTVRGFLPVSEMSEAYIQDPAQHFRLGQVVNVHALSVDAAQGRLAVSCKDPSTFTEKYRKAFEDMKPGLLVSGTVFEKTNDDALLKLDDSGLVARLDVQHVIDGSPSKQTSTLSKIRVGQKLNDLLVVDIQRAHRLIRVSGRASLKKAAKQGAMPCTFEDVKEGATVTGFIRNITPAGLFAEFLGGLTGLIPKRLIEDANLAQPQFGTSKGQTVSATVHSVDPDFQRFFLSQKASEVTHEGPKKTKTSVQNDNVLANPVDEGLKTISDLTFGRVVKCKVVSVRSTQVNVQLADNIQGRIDVSEIFDKWEDLKDRKQPLRFFKAKQVLSAKILGVHDARNHKFLPISHRSGKYPVFELSLKPSFVKAANPEPLNMEQVKVGSSWMGFVNNVADDCLWINLSPNVRGRLRFIDASDDLSLLTDVDKNFPIGSALKVQVTAVDADRGHLDLSAKQGFDKLSFGDVSVGMILPGRVTKVTEKQVIMQLGEALVGAVNLIDMADDYSKANPTVHNKNEVLRACVIAVDKAHKKIFLSLRPSRVLSSSMPVQDREISSIAQLKPNDVVRGFVKRVADAGLFVGVGHDVTAYVRVSDLSDSYLKEWKDSFQPDQLVKGKVTFVDAEQGKLQMSLKDSVLDPNYKAPVTLRDFKLGQVVTGKIRKVEEFGAFIVIDGSANVSGLCHRSEMAEKRVEDARTLYDEGDAVKAKIIKIDSKAGKISFSLKASHFQNEEEEDDDEDMSDAGAGGVELEGGESGDEDDDDVSMGGVDIEEESEEEEEEDSDDDASMKGASKEGGLGASGFDWSGNFQGDNEAAESDSDEEDSKQKKKKNRKPEIQVDRTGELDANGPQTVADYERLLLGEPDSSLLWLQYMAFQLELGETEKARTIAERALHTITMGQDAEKLNIWVALLNLENTYGDDDSLEEIFKRACQYNDPQEIYDRMISIYIQSGKNEKADELFQTAMKKKISTQSPKFFLNYASFLFDTMAAPERARALLPRALQSLPTHTHVETTSKFGQLEFRSANGDAERGRTVFEGLLSSFPKRIDLWNVLLDLEIKAGDADQVRRLFERVLGLQRKKGAVQVDASKKVKPKQARFLFKKWLAFEEKLAVENNDEKMVEEIKARAAAYFISIACGIVLSFFPNEYDRAARSWMQDDLTQHGDDIRHWPTDISRDIVPANCHSHNDYWRRIPLFSALQAGCTGVEADVWLFDDELYVGHTTHALTKRRTLRSLYVDPLVQLLDLQNPITSFQRTVDRPPHGVFDTDPGQTLILLIDFKTDGATTWPVVVKHLAPLRERGYLTYFNGRDLIPGPVTVVGTGNTPFDLVTANTSYRDIFFDAPLDKLIGDEGLGRGHASAYKLSQRSTGLGQGLSGMPDTITANTFNVTNSYYASRRWLPWPFHFTSHQMELIRTQIRVAHRHGLKVRYWSVPSWPRSLRNHIWRILVQEGVDMLNVDDLVAATKGDWRIRILDWWW
ncbi:RRNA biogenesis protein RRP5 [Penicillium macrosclerotiorum]|uniref:RRNA biogenesis protein RRP5 n=1 Tax=Penicillium macrosclerotiorum TaxID=303699 RepID=UPI002548D586|nr:RRNA biogenesis protein RRP5 [Penicillium macrosclerotiorum]KAJ5690552.1 RRNA biogenesis protein RRP5 [Penicillium macrosclerotiorum]